MYLIFPDTVLLWRRKRKKLSRRGARMR